MKSNSVTLIWFRWQIENQSGVKQIQRVTLSYYKKALFLEMHLD